MNYKELTQEELEDIFEGVTFKTPPMKHQLISLVFALDKQRKRVNYIHDIGTGKTLTALYTMMLWKAKKTLVVCPNSVLEKTWIPQIHQHTNFSCIPLTGSTEERKKKLEENFDIYVINYEGLPWLYCRRDEVIVNGKRKREFVIDPKLYIDGFDCIVFDEIHKLKSFKSLRTKICRRLSNKAKYAIGLTGTPVATGELDLWSEYWVLDLGQTLGTNFYRFRDTYFYERFYDWGLKRNAKDQIMRKLEHCTIRFDREECFELPEKQYQIRSAFPTEEQLQLINNVLEGNTIEIGNGSLNTEQTLTASMRLLQVTGGHLPTFTEDGVKTINRIITPKLQLLLECIEEVKGKVIVFHQFEDEGRQIEEMLRKNKISYRSLRGEIKDKQHQYECFRSNPKIKVLVAHPKCGGEGIDLIEATTMIFYSNSYSPIDRAQSEGRIYRKGQTKKCLFIDLVLEGTIDEIVAQRVEDRKTMLENILDYMRQYHLNERTCDGDS
ncbi:MAG: DEAD/DEAH box helicase [Candidatus Hodarchaeales archaeon]